MVFPFPVFSGELAVCTPQVRKVWIAFTHGPGLGEVSGRLNSAGHLMGVTLCSQPAWCDLGSQVSSMVAWGSQLSVLRGPDGRCEASSK